MTTIREFILIWIVGWIICSFAYMLSSLRKAKLMDIDWSFQKSLFYTPILFITWPFAVAIYVYFNMKLRMNNSTQLPKGLEATILPQKQKKKDIE